MPIQMPEGKSIAISLGPDFDAHSVWMGTFRTNSQTSLSRGEFGAEVGVPRLIEAYKRYGITTTWCVPTHTMQTFPAAFERVMDAGHEIAAHGVYHEFVPKLEIDEERRLLELQVETHRKLVGKVPRGYRSPALDITDNTLALLAETGFEWDSSMMGRDVTPYRPRMVTETNLESANVFGPSSKVLEFPVSWALDDFPELELLKGNATQQSNATVLERWKDSFDYAREYTTGSLLTWTLHPQTIGRSHNMLMLERFLDYVTGFDDVWFPTLSEVFDRWSDD